MALQCLVRPFVAKIRIGVILVNFEGNASLVEINLLDLGPGGHTLTITFSDVNGNEGSSRLNLTGQTRERE